MWDMFLFRFLSLETPLASELLYPAKLGYCGALAPRKAVLSLVKLSAHCAAVGGKPEVWGAARTRT
jgi:hypothetical protein